MKTKSIGFIGGGRISRIFLQSLKDVVFSSIKVCDINTEVLSNLKENFSQIEISTKISSLVGVDLLIIALHPPKIKEVGNEIAEIVSPETLVVSLAPKFTIENLSNIIQTKHIVRIIPNASSIINRGYNPVCFSDTIKSSDKNLILDMLEIMGECVQTKEEKLEAYAIASAMLPTYFWFQWKDMESIGQLMGLTPKESKDAVYETLKASLELMYQSKLDYEEVVDLIPIKPLADKEDIIKDAFNENLMALYQKIKPA